MSSATANALKNQSLIYGGEVIGVRVSLGVTELQEGENSDALLRRADDALYRAKSGGRDQVQTAAAA